MHRSRPDVAAACVAGQNEVMRLWPSTCRKHRLAGLGTTAESPCGATFFRRWPISLGGSVCCYWLGAGRDQFPAVTQSSVQQFAVDDDVMITSAALAVIIWTQHAGGTTSSVTVSGALNRSPRVRVSLVYRTTSMGPAPGPSESEATAITSMQIPICCSGSCKMNRRYLFQHSCFRPL